MTTDAVLTDEQIEDIIEDIAWPNEEVMQFGKTVALTIEQAVLQSPEIRALRKDAERYRFMRSVENGAVLEAAIDAAMENQP